MNNYLIAARLAHGEKGENDSSVRYSKVKEKHARHRVVSCYSKLLNNSALFKFDSGSRHCESKCVLRRLRDSGIFLSLLFFQWCNAHASYENKACLASLCVANNEIIEQKRWMTRCEHVGSRKGM